MSQPAFNSVSKLLVRWKAREQGALEELVPLVYEELRNIARRQLRRERPEHTLQSAALVHEAYLSLVEHLPFDACDRTHSIGVASRLMRQIPVDYARSHGADRKVELDVSRVVSRVCCHRSAVLM